MGGGEGVGEPEQGETLGFQAYEIVYLKAQSKRRYVMSSGNHK